LFCAPQAATAKATGNMIFSTVFILKTPLIVLHVVATMAQMYVQFANGVPM
jgi:hypothetical protein